MGRKRLGVALSGGGARGFVHIGVLQALEAAGVRVDFFAGTSVGALIGAAYAAGVPLGDILAFASSPLVRPTALWRWMDLSIPRTGLIQGHQVEQWLGEILGEKTFADLQVPLTVVAVDLNSGKEAHLTKGRLTTAVRASMAVPGIFAPVEMQGMRLVDGGLLNNVPVDVVRQMGADVVVGVDVTSDNEASFWRSLAQKRLLATTVGGVLVTLSDALGVVMRAHTLERLQRYPPNFLLRPPIPSSITAASAYDHAEELISLGKKAAETMLPALQAQIRG